MKESTKTIAKWMKRYNEAEAENKRLREAIQEALGLTMAKFPAMGRIVLEQAFTRKEQDSETT